MKAKVQLNSQPHITEVSEFEREGYARAYLQIAGRWQDHVLTARVNDALV
ncbi:hypothetical protein EMIT051CA3_10054 [Pseudomonas chlororaphis]